MTRSRLALILLLNFTGIVLFLSWYWPPGHGFWMPADVGVFRFFNNALAGNYAFAMFLAITNNRAFDGCSLLCMGLLMLWYWWHETPEGRRRIVIMGVVMLLSAIVLNQVGHVLPVVRPSPTHTLNDIYRVSDLLHFPTKDASRDCYPGDHGMMLMIFSGFMLRYFGKTAFTLALAIVAVFALPRIMIGAHWFTDVFNGSLSVVLVGLPWILITPLSDRLIDGLNAALPGKHKQITHI
ncbi:MULTISPECIES: phosphatase PAP2 family protein [Tenebrionibacter/Tenebrionicola group]|jgi:membrane-associated phospholipid phosphatase|uniref:Lipid A 1-diphosphate synthase n=2 Tax=Tenebrionibacter/Tenebrionicola group TaxID=2969848 RepID=A0A8K0V024_9ENTR|nr:MULTISPECIES: phosphatase PAP2 family protein [Tenebrionibacter/Tenebrionicola group]MBK4714142.1 phosphatase PAP2 family protein [Tenebrionibacter intestinalis]MBV4411968.1 phosphatase PAP2 family protein [Tenebrionicola larvae]MBV5094828.1 phosphatase PAP2 family protein [Tenebrionicola larvae]